MLALVALCAFAAATPGVLIVRIKPPKGVLGLDSPICSYLANEIQVDGRLAPIAWELTDPIYRAAVEEGKISTGSMTPTLNEALAAASKLHVEYVLTTDVRGDAGGVLSAAELFKHGKLIWKDPNVDIGPALANLRERLKKKLITQDDYNRAVLNVSFRSNAIQAGRFGVDDTLKSVAHTWVDMIVTGPLAALPKETARATPNPGKGDQPPAADPGAHPAAGSIDKKWKTDATAALAAGDPDKAVSLLRDAIDAAPLDSERRVFLINTLIQAGQPEVAAREARRAGELMPTHIEFRSLAARAWIQAGNIDEAQSDLNEAVSRAPDSPETRMLLAYVAIAKGDSVAAIGHLDKAIAGAPTGDAYYLRGLAHAMNGETELAAADVKKSTDSGLSQDPREAESRYTLVASIFDTGLDAIGADIRTLHSKAQVNRADPEVQTTYEDLLKRVNGRNQFVSELPVPQAHASSHNRRILAYKLLLQSMLDLGSFIKSGDGDVLTDSRINLGEALKQGASARLGFREEQRGLKKGNAKSG